MPEESVELLSENMTWMVLLGWKQAWPDPGSS